MKKTRIPEKVVQYQITSTLRVLGAAVYTIGHPSPSDGRAHRGTMQTPGIPDLLAFVPNPRATGGRDALILLCIECKAAGGRLRPEQLVFRERCKLAGVAHVVGDLDAVIAWLIQEGIATARQFPHYRLPATTEARP